jgi:arginyl-tRNA synthetase
MDILKNLLTKLKVDFELDFGLTQDYQKGLLTSNDAFRIAKLNGTNPNLIAIDICKKLNIYFNDSKDQFEAENAGPYINIKPKSSLTANLISMDSMDFVQFEKVDQSIIFDYFQPNIAKNLHTAHIRSLDIGESLKRIMSLKYSKVLSERHLGDWGVQFGILIWGIVNGHNHRFQKIDFDKNSQDILDELTKLYVQTNDLIKENPEVRKEATKITAKLESEFRDFDGNYENTKYLKYWHKITIASIAVIESQSARLGLNQSGFWNYTQSQNWPSEIQNLLQNTAGIWLLNQQRRDGVQDLDFGESYLSKVAFEEFENFEKSECFVTEIDNGIKKMFIDLEEEKLGRAYLVSSEGYTTYIFRDVIARFLWAGLFETRLMFSIVDVRQSHSFKQVFAVIKRLIKSQYYQKFLQNNSSQKLFGVLNKDQVLKAIQILENDSLIHISFGLFKTDNMAMSSRKGKGFSLKSFLDEVDNAVINKLEEKSAIQKVKNDQKKPEQSSLTIEKTGSNSTHTTNQLKFESDKIVNLANASIKWFDLYRDYEQDINFELKDVINFEGNTGMYQLYTVSRLKSILKKVNSSQSFENQSNFEIAKLDETELNLINYSLRFELIIDLITKNYKTHLLCNYLFEYATLVNSWYAKTYIINEPDKVRQLTLLKMTAFLINHFEIALSLLAIQTVDQI